MWLGKTLVVGGLSAFCMVPENVFFFFFFSILSSWITRTSFSELSIVNNYKPGIVYLVFLEKRHMLNCLLSSYCP